ncbi:unnamed protein product [Lepidochelys kempii]
MLKRCSWQNMAGKVTARLTGDQEKPDGEIDPLPTSNGVRVVGGAHLVTLPPTPGGSRLTPRWPALKFVRERGLERPETPSPMGQRLEEELGAGWGRGVKCRRGCLAHCPAKWTQLRGPVLCTYKLCVRPCSCRLINLLFYWLAESHV